MGAKLIPTVRALVNEHQAALPASLISELQLMLADPITGPSGEFNGNTAFFNSDSMVHRANGWYMSVRMKSKRAQGNEDFESKGKTWHSGSGMLLTKVHGDEVLLCVTNHQPCHISDDLQVCTSARAPMCTPMHLDPCIQTRAAHREDL